MLVNTRLLDCYCHYALSSQTPYAANASFVAALRAPSLRAVRQKFDRDIFAFVWPTSRSPPAAYDARYCCVAALSHARFRLSALCAAAMSAPLTLMRFRYHSPEMTRHAHADAAPREPKIRCHCLPMVATPPLSLRRFCRAVCLSQRF